MVHTVQTEVRMYMYVKKGFIHHNLTSLKVSDKSRWNFLVEVMQFPCSGVRQCMQTCKTTGQEKEAYEV